MTNLVRTLAGGRRLPAWMLALHVIMHLFFPALIAAATADRLPPSQPATWDLLEELRVGHWVELRGAWLAEDEAFRAERLEVRPPQNRSEIWGVASSSASGEPMVLGRVVTFDRGTEWPESIAGMEELVGRRLRVLGDRGAGGTFAADVLDRRKPGVDRLVGRIDRLRRVDGAVEVEVLGFEVLVAVDVRQRVRAEADQPFDARASAWTAPVRALRTASITWENADDFLGRGWRPSSELHTQLREELSFSSRRNPELDARDDVSEEDRDDLSHQLRGRMSWSPNARVTTVVDMSHRVRNRDPGVGDSSTRGQLRLREGWVLFRDVAFGFDVQVGRQDFEEPREWLFDDDLDGIRLYRRFGPALLQASVSRSFDLGLESTSSRNRAATNQILYLSNLAGPRHYAAYVVHRDFGPERGERATHQGVRSSGRLGDHWRFWSELSLLTGDRDGREVEAWGGDVGLRWRGRGALRPTVTLGWAQGEGDDGSSSMDRRFRQTGLQDNNSRVGGGSFVRYYGELINPELSNLRISTVGFGFEIARRTTLELIAHHYRQDVASRRLTNTDLERRPNGVDPDLGWELDAVLSLRSFRKIDVELVGAWFRHGGGFAADEADDASLFRLQFRYLF